MVKKTAAKKTEAQAFPFPLTLKQRKAAAAAPYARSKAEAALIGGYAESGLNSAVNHNYRNPKFLRAVAEAEEKAISDAIASPKERKEFLSATMRNKLGDDTVKIDARLSASDQLNRMESVYVERSQNLGSIDLHIIYDSPPPQLPEKSPDLSGRSEAV